MSTTWKKKIDLVFHGLVLVGGGWVAVFGPMAVIIIGFVIPFSGPKTLTYLLKLLQIAWFKWFLFFMMVLPIWYGLARILSALGRSSIQHRRGPLLFNALALIWTAHVGYVLFILANTH